MFDFGDVIGAIKIKDGLFIGDQLAASDIDFVGANKVTHIINCCARQVQNYFEKDGVLYMNYYWNDNDTQVILDSKDTLMNDVFEFIEEALDQGESILIHSYRGQSRSCTLATAYLIRKYSWTLRKAMEYMCSRRPDLSIKPNFVQQLYGYESRIQKSVLPKSLSDNWNNYDKNDGSEDAVLRNTFINSQSTINNAITSTTYSIPLNQTITQPKIKWVDKITQGKVVLEQTEPNSKYSIKEKKVPIYPSIIQSTKSVEDAMNVRELKSIMKKNSILSFQLLSNKKNNNDTILNDSQTTTTSDNINNKNTLLNSSILSSSLTNSILLNNNNNSTNNNIVNNTNNNTNTLTNGLNAMTLNNTNTLTNHSSNNSLSVNLKSNSNLMNNTTCGPLMTSNIMNTTLMNNNLMSKELIIKKKSIEEDEKRKDDKKMSVFSIDHELDNRKEQKKKLNTSLSLFDALNPTLYKSNLSSNLSSNFSPISPISPISYNSKQRPMTAIPAKTVTKENLLNSYIASKFEKKNDDLKINLQTKQISRSSTPKTKQRGESPSKNDTFNLTSKIYNPPSPITKRPISPTNRYNPSQNSSQTRIPSPSTRNEWKNQYTNSLSAANSVLNMTQQMQKNALMSLSNDFTFTLPIKKNNVGNALLKRAPSPTPAFNRSSGGSKPRWRV